MGCSKLAVAAIALATQIVPVEGLKFNTEQLSLDQLELMVTFVVTVLIGFATVWYWTQKWRQQKDHRVDFVDDRSHDEPGSRMMMMMMAQAMAAGFYGRPQR